MSTTTQTVLITGATAGIGRETALYLARAGYHVIATGRRSAELDKLRAEKPAGSRLDTAMLDVTNPASIAAAVAEVDRLTSGRGVDALVNNAGYGLVGPLTEISDGDLRKQFDTNVFGLMAVTRAFVPRMRERGKGRIVNISSMGGKMTFPFMGAYNSTKYAVESLSDALRYELRAFGIDVTLIEPGVIRTNFEATAVANLNAFATTAYGPAIAKYEEMSKQADRFAGEPIVVAKAITRAVEARRPAARYVAPRFNSFAFAMSALLPTRVWDWAMRKAARLDSKHLNFDAAPAPAAKPATHTRSASNLHAAPN